MHIITTFSLGRLVATRNALNQIGELELYAGLKRHAARDWGDLDSDDRAANDAAIDSDGRILSAYVSRDGTRFWIITEWDRSSTTILLPEDY
ncbi:MAG: hypothetical protein ACYC96_09735 [Fimbriimonadaceae bacterium]